MVASAINQRHRIMPFAELCTPACPHPSYPLLAIMLLRSDVEPHNFVLDRTAHVRLIGFSSAAPLVPGSCLVPPEYGRVLVEHTIISRPSLNRMDVAESAVVLHWQGTDSSLKPALITNSDGMSGVSVQLPGCIIDLATAVLDVKAPQKHAQDLSCGDDNIEQKVGLEDVQRGRGVGMM
jgi:hypothetical protein